MEKNKYNTNWSKFQFRLPLILNGFDPLFNQGKPISPSSHVQLQIGSSSFQENYEVVKKNILDSIGKKYLPIYRMGDGEFNFINNLERGKLTFFNKINNIRHNIISLSRKHIMYDRKLQKSLFEEVKNIFDPYYFKVAHNEAYTSAEQKLLRLKYIKDLKTILYNGYLALHFVDHAKGNHHPWFEKYKPICDWLDKYDLSLEMSNYTSCYYIYAIFTSKDRELLLKGKNILILTAANTEKIEKLNQFFILQESVHSVDFYNISATKSMLEKIEFKKLKSNYDLVLVSAGIGSSNILTQCEKFNTVCIDVGMLLELFANPELKYTRIFLTSN